jgi:cobalt-zinc-cadmium efflux system protein
MTECGAEHPESGQRQHNHPGARREHGRDVTASSDSRYIALARGLIVSFLVFEVVMAFAGNSLALLADAGHMLTDAGALGASLVAVRLARRPASGVWTFGFKRAEVLSAQANGITLLVVSALVAFEAISRLIHPVAVTGGIVVTVAAVGVAVNVAATWVMARASRDSINVKGAFAHIVTDLYAFTGTLIAGIVIIITGFERADSIASLIVVVLMLHAAWGLLRETGRILLEAAPEGYAPDDIITAITGQPGVASVHDVHVWLITSGFPALSALCWSGARLTATRHAASWSSCCASVSAWTTRPCRSTMHPMTC